MSDDEKKPAAKGSEPGPEENGGGGDDGAWVGGEEFPDQRREAAVHPVPAIPRAADNVRAVFAPCTAHIKFPFLRC